MSETELVRLSSLHAHLSRRLPGAPLMSELEALLVAIDEIAALRIMVRALGNRLAELEQQS